MKKFILSVAVLTMIILTTNSCQNDDGGSSQALTKTSPLTNLLLRVTHNPTLAGKSENETNEFCFTVNLPVTIENNGQSVTVTSQDDYATVQNALHQCDDDSTSVSFVFPINITFADGTTQTINSTEGLQQVLDTCSDEDEDEDDIECLNIHYPINITYTDANNLSTVVILNTDDEAYAFLTNLEATNSIVISYPLTITDATGTTVIVNNNDDLQTAIEEADSECGHHDGDHNDDDENNDNGGGKMSHH
ncbi:hypothetical protein [Flavobacterium sp. GT3R68]|uniref:hypothetical protein n=1 Tax=Flavobacterium sp. GT3R68 TaxID=2594437 RepID=UPI000F87C038|nr:hypothetical protein [Flavobacterium sp. GT3R68]RTY96015.1 hypothetical protein EKL32_05055 [Flavobacterium sp. GSN2]TRW93788.1 hypothetical protein FNW07_02445 [Flavobacterium sp. GT3R68]